MRRRVRTRPRPNLRFERITLPAQTSRILTGPELLLALTITKEPVKWLRPKSKDQMIPALMAIPIVKGGVYEGKVRPGRVYFIREIDNRKPPEKDIRYQDDRAVMRWWYSWDKRDLAKHLDAWTRIHNRIVTQRVLPGGANSSGN
jgi:hypothetical protein